MGLSRNKVAVPEGAAGTPPFWRRPPVRPPHLIIYICMISDRQGQRTQGETFARNKKEKKEAAARMPDIILKVVRPALLAVSLILKARE